MGDSPNAAYGIFPLEVRERDSKENIQATKKAYF
jgi:hypothetical protein